MNFFEVFQSFGGNLWLYGGSFILILSILVFIHEWGHYIIARLSGVKVEVFSIGFGKELFGFDDKHGTRWKFSLIPLGGYVKLFGDVDPASVKYDENVEDPETRKIRPMTKAEKEVAFYAKSVWKRAAIVFAGPAINYIFAIILLTGLFVLNGKPVTPPSAAAVISGSAAEKYNFLPHDEIISIDGKNMNSFEDIRREMMIALDEEKHFIVNRNGKIIDIYAKPERIEEEDRFGFRHSRGLLGLISPRHAVDITNIKAVDGKAYDDIEGVREALINKLDKKFVIEVERGIQTDTLFIHPLKELNDSLLDPESNQHGLLFISQHKGNVFVQFSPGDAFFKALQESWDVTRGTLEALGQMVAGTRSATELGGIIRIGAVAGDMAKQGLIAMIFFTALLSINLGLINLFPIPMLDGGHLVFYLFEVILGKPVPDQIQEYAFRAGLVFLVGIMVFANLNDLVQLIL